MSGGSKKDGQQPIRVNSYYATILFILCHGTLDRVRKIFVDNRELTSINPAAGDNLVRDPNLFGGTSREGGIEGNLHIQHGTATQAINGFLQNQIGTGIPAYRGLAYAMLQDMYVGLNYYFKQWTFEVERIHLIETGTQWFDSAAQINETPFSATLAVAVDHIQYILQLSSVTNLSTLYMDDILSLGSEKVQVTGIDRGTNRIFVTRGVNGTSVDDLGLGELHNSHAAGTSILGYTPKLINAVHVVRECLTNSVWGLNVPGYLIDETDFVNAASSCFTDGLGFSWFWNQDIPLDDFIAEVIKHIKAELYVDKKTGIYHLKLIRQITDTSGLFVLDNTNINEITAIHRTQLPELISRVQVSFTNVISGANNTVSVSNNALIAQQNVPVLSNKTYSGVVTPLVAHKLAHRDLQLEGKPKYSCTITCNRTAEDLNPGDAFIINKPDIFGSQIVCRVVTINLGDSVEGKITIEAVEDNFSNISIDYTPSLPPITQRFSSNPHPSEHRIIREIPYYVLAQYAGDSTAQSYESDTTFLLVSAQRPSPDSYGANLYTSTDNINFTRHNGMEFCFTSTLNGAITPTTTAITLTSVTNFSDLVAEGEFLEIEDELVKVVSISGSVVTVSRGVLDTVPTSHADDSFVSAWQNYNGSNQVQYLVGEDIYVKLPTVTGKGEMKLSETPSDTFTFVGRMHKPYPPGNVKVNSVAYPSSITGTATISWSHRDRLLQTAELIPTTDGNIGPEPGTTYTLRLYDSSNTLVRTETGLTSTSYVWATEVADSGLGTLNPNFRFELESVRGDSISFQKHDISVIRTGSLVASDSPLSAITSLTSTSLSTGVKFDWSSLGGTYELRIGTVNDRDDSTTENISSLTSATYTKVSDIGTYYAWVRRYSSNKVSSWYPSSSTAGISGTVQDDVTALLTLITP